TAAGGMAQFHAQMESLGESMGTVLLPAVKNIAQALAGLASFFAQHTTLAKVLVIGLGALAAALIAVSVATSAVNTAMLANPIGLVIVAIAALAAGLVVLYERSATFRAIVQAAFQAVGEAVHWLAGEWEAHRMQAIATWHAIEAA